MLVQVPLPSEKLPDKSSSAPVSLPGGTDMFLCSRSYAITVRLAPPNAFESACRETSNDRPESHSLFSASMNIFPLTGDWCKWISNFQVPAK